MKFIRGALPDSTDSDLVEIFDLQTASQETFEKKVDAVAAGEYEPVVAVEMVESFVEAFVIIELADFDGGTDDDLRAVALEQRVQLLCLRRRARDYDRSSCQRLHESFRRYCRGGTPWPPQSLNLRLGGGTEGRP